MNMKRPEPTRARGVSLSAGIRPDDQLRTSLAASFNFSPACLTFAAA